HKNCREWWYATGYLNDEAGNFYSFQFTLLHLGFRVCTPKAVMVAVIRHAKHHKLP
ncbi:MAG: carotenoid 1,2-hydratase, partial [Oscillospiraceae bacterium]|nr:carotenoid 1,2-hydratase [Oscillospiraceae bacterium]